MKLLSTILFVITTLSLSAQAHPSCDGVRYLEDIFTEIDSTLDIKYGEGTTIAGANEELFFDIFEPAGDLELNRPVVVLAYGGSYIGGTRTDMHWLCKRYARKGFVAVAIEYRLYDLPLFPFPTASEMKVVVTKSVADMKGCIRHLRADADGADIYKIDPNLVFVGGISAGGITACHTAFLDEEDNFDQELLDIFDAEGGLEGNVNDLPYPSNVQGLLNFSGGLNDANWIDKDDPTFLSVHETGDGTVPYGQGFANIFGIDIISMEGSQRLKYVADSVEVENYLMAIEADTHTAYFFDDDLTTEIVDWSSRYLHDIVCEQNTLNVVENSLLAGLNIYPNPVENFLYLEGINQHHLKINITNTMGQQIFSKENVSAINVSQFSPGIYYVEIFDKKSADRIIEKIIVR